MTGAGLARRLGWQLPRSSQFRRLLAGQGISLIGSQVTLLGLPLTAAVVLHASPSQMGILVALETLPVLVLSLFVGIWVDRLRRRPILIGADLGRAGLIGSVPAAALLGVLHVEQLYVVAFLMGALSLCFDTASPAYLPLVVADDELTAGYSALGLGESTAEVIGPGLAGMLVQILSAPLALIVDCISFLVSGGLLLTVNTPEPTPQRSSQSPSIVADLREGLSAVMGEPTLRAIAFCVGSAGIFLEMRTVLLIPFATRELGLDSVGLGVILAMGSIGGMLGAVAGPWLIGRLGLQGTFVATVLLVPLTLAITPLSAGSVFVAGAVLLVGQTLFQAALMASNVSVRLLRQKLSPEHLLGRVTATMRLLTWGALPLGALLGGALGEHVGLRSALMLSAIGSSVGCLWLLSSSIQLPAMGRSQASMLLEMTNPTD